MDLTNGCTTNVHVLDTFAATPFTHYTYSATHSDVKEKIREAQRAIAELRASKALCTLVDQDVWLFGHVEHGLGEKYSLAREGVVEGQQDAIRHLLDAIESALTHSLVSEDRLTHIAPWTWLYSDRDADDESDASIIMLRVKETSQGALYLLPETTPTDLRPIDQAFDRVDKEILLAPHGRVASLAAEDAKSVVEDALWKARVADALRLEGISLEEDVEWTNVEFVEDGMEFSCTWPSYLCLVHQSPQLPVQLATEDLADWKTWIDNGHGRTYRDPIAEAEEWFLDSTERKRRAAEESGKGESHIDNNFPVNTTSANDLSMTTSPPFMQRTADHQVAMSGIYPTPPDGLAQHGQTQLGAQIGMGAATPSVAQTGDAATGNEILHDTQDQGEDSSGLHAFQMDEIEEDLFGDVGGEMFEENEVGDADFDYFDEPDDVPAVGTIAEGGDTQMMDGSTLNDLIDGNVEQQPGRGNADISHGVKHDVEPVSSPPPAVVPAKVAADAHSQQQALETNARALSPFGIRERLLPPPVPASIAHGSDNMKQLRRSSSFAPIVFRDGADLGAKYANVDITTGPDGTVTTSGPNIGLPHTKKNDESDDDSDESGSSDRDDHVELPPRLPWESTKKRKRSWATVEIGTAEMGRMWAEENENGFENSDDEQQRIDRETLLGHLLAPLSQADNQVVMKHLLTKHQQQSHGKDEEEELLSPEELYDLGKEDLICIAQLVSEQASTCLVALSPATIQEQGARYPETLLNNALAKLFSSPLDTCDLPSLALTRDSTPPARTNTRTPVPPRPGPEVPDIFSLPAPYIRIQRNNDNWEMLPSVLSFWESSGLAAASGPKNVRARAVFPSNKDLRGAVQGLMGALGRTYEGCKLGTHSYEGWNGSESDAGALVEEDGETGTKTALLQGYARACADLGEELAMWCTGSGTEWEGTLVVYILDPFSGGGSMGTRKYLCACFWVLFQSYSKKLKTGRKERNDRMVPDVVLQILPIELVADMDRMVIPETATLANLAREVYDRCPASSAAEEEGYGATAPAVLLAPPMPKRIAFQLLADVPTESLLQDGRVLHLAVAMSGDREWMTCVWNNGQGRTLMHESLCLRGLTVGSVVKDAWQRTVELVGRVGVGWRIFVVLDEGVWIGSGLEKVWRDVVAAGRAGGTTVCVTLAKARTEMAFTVTGEDMGWDGAVGLATPASTPVAFASGNGMTTGTNSPNIGASDGFGAPLTPAASESTVSASAAAMMVVENDHDAHLVEVEDESCGLLLKPHFSALVGLDGMGNGAIIRKGGESGGQRGTLGVSICWTLQVKPIGAVDMGSLRQAEVTLREVLKMYRALSVLTRARGLHKGEGGVLPVHLAVAQMGARGLEGMTS